MRVAGVFIILTTVFFIPVCKKRPEKNFVPIEQIGIDKTNDYRYIFSEDIEKQKKREKMDKKDEFKK